MKKWLAITLAVMMLLSLLTACNGVTNSGTVTSTGPATESEVGYETRELSMACSFSETTTFSAVINYFCDYVEDHSGGKITFRRYQGGTFCTGTEELEYVSNGSIDISNSMPAYSKEVLPLIELVGNHPDGMEAAVKMSKYIYMENEETAKLARAETEAYNVVILGIYTAPEGGHCATKPITGWDDLKDCLYGTGAFAGAFEGLGLNVQTIPVGDMYESLSRGVVNAAGGGIANIYQMKWYEICKYALHSSVCNGMLPIWMNLDTFNSLSPAAQALMYEAADAASAYSIKAYTAADQEGIEYIRSIGGEVNEMSDEDNRLYIEQLYYGNYKDYYKYAAALGHGEDFDTLAQAAIDYMNLNITLADLKANMG